jgi:hypothetical protein
MLPWVIMICIAKLLAVNPKQPPVNPNAMRMQEAMASSPPLARLQQLMRESNDRFEAVRPVLPAALAAHVKPGPVDGDGWSLLAANAAVAAKLRQLQPRLEDALGQRGWQVTAIRIKVQSASR